MMIRPHANTVKVIFRFYISSVFAHRWKKCDANISQTLFRNWIPLHPALLLEEESLISDDIVVKFFKEANVLNFFKQHLAKYFKVTSVWRIMVSVTPAP